MNPQPPSIDNLPYDIFRQIIVYTHTHGTQGPYPQRSDFSRLQTLAPPVSASHVCRGWRDALLSDQTLWTNVSIPEIKPSGVQELILRSQSAPLNVSIIMKNELITDMSSSLALIFQQLDRFKSLHVYIELARPLLWSFPQMAPIRELLSFLQRPASRLQSFSFKYFSSDRSFRHMVLENLFSGSAPNLKHLSYQISNTVYRQLHPRLFDRLSELHLTCCQNTNLDSALAFLEISPFLEVLGIYMDRYSVIPKASSEASKSVNLPHLRKLMLGASHSNALIKFASKFLTIPPNVKWDISVTVNHRSHTLEPLLSDLIPHVQFTYLEAFFETSSYLTPGDNGVLMDSNELEHDGGSKLTYYFSNTTFKNQIWSDLLLISMDLSSITHFDFDFVRWKKFPLKPIFTTIFFHMENLEHLVLRQEIALHSYLKAQPFLRCLSLLMSSKEGDEKPLCPLLRQMTVKLGELSTLQPENMLCIRSDIQRERRLTLQIIIPRVEIWEHFKSAPQLKDVHFSLLPYPFCI